MSNAELSRDVEPFDSGDIPHALAQIARLHEGVKSEFDLIAGRMSWLVISESFIVSAFVTAISNYRLDHTSAIGLLYLIRVTPLVGMLLASFVYVAILAAHRAIATLKRQREQMIANLPSRLRIDLISTGSSEQWWGNLPTYVIPPILFLVWAGAYASLLWEHGVGH